MVLIFQIPTPFQLPVFTALLFSQSSSIAAPGGTIDASQYTFFHAAGVGLIEASLRDSPADRPYSHHPNFGPWGFVLAHRSGEFLLFVLFLLRRDGSMLHNSSKSSFSRFQASESDQVLPNRLSRPVLVEYQRQINQLYDCFNYCSSYYCPCDLGGRFGNQKHRPNQA